MITAVVFQLYCVQEALLRLQCQYGTAFVLRFIDGLERPWTVRR